MSEKPNLAEEHGLSRREFVVAGGVGAVLIAGGGIVIPKLLAGTERKAPGFDSSAITLTAVESEVQLGAASAATWTFDGYLPGHELRITQGEPVRIRLVNELSDPTTIHWHGIRLANAADGVPDMTQSAVEPGGEFVYEFTPPDAGTFFLHPHVGTQLDRGLYSPLIVEARNEKLAYDSEAVLVIDDWLDGVAGTPDQRLAAVEGGAMSGMQMGATSAGDGRRTVLASTSETVGATPLPTTRSSSTLNPISSPGDLAGLAVGLESGLLDPGDIPDYPLYLLNGRPPEDPFIVDARSGDRVRLRMINASGDTIYRVFVEGHELEVVAADGMSTRPVRTDSLVMGMGERYDAIVKVGGQGISRIIAMPLGKEGGPAIAHLRPAGTTTPPPPPDASYRAPRRVLSYAELLPTEQAAAAVPHVVDPREIQLDLDFRSPYEWTIGGQLFAEADPITVDRGERIRFTMQNKTTMPHPMHLHGHSFAVNSAAGVRKDTALALPGQRLTLDWVADNPGVWAYHCHNIYHQEAGMMRQVEVS